MESCLKCIGKDFLLLVEWILNISLETAAATCNSLPCIRFSWLASSTAQKDWISLCRARRKKWWVCFEMKLYERLARSTLKPRLWSCGPRTFSCLFRLHFWSGNRCEILSFFFSLASAEYSAGVSLFVGIIFFPLPLHVRRDKSSKPASLQFYLKWIFLEVNSDDQTSFPVSLALLLQVLFFLLCKQIDFTWMLKAIITLKLSFRNVL